MAIEKLPLPSLEKPSFRGIRIDDPSLDNGKWKTLALGTEAFAKLRRTEIEGELLPEGRALVISNHVSLLDIFALPWLATESAGRSMRLVARDTLLDPSIQESEEVLRRLGKLPPREISEREEVVLPEPKVTLVKKIIAGYLKSAGNPIPIHRGELSNEFVNNLSEALEDEQMVGMFAQETRTAQNDISQIKGGPAVLLARYFPDTPAQVVTMAHLTDPLRRPVMRISEPFSFNQLKSEKGYGLKDFREHIKDTFFEQLVQDVPDLKR